MIMITKDDFRTMISAAMSGDQRALERVFEVYAPLINKYSVIEGDLDEDCRQYIMFHIARNIHKFRL